MKRKSAHLVSIVVALALPLTGFSEAANEYQVKAALVLNFVKFSEWPQRELKATNEAIVICVLGESPFERMALSTLAGKLVDGRPVSVRDVHDTKEACLCHVLFVAGSEQRRFRHMNHALKTASVLTVGEADWFIRDGGVINFRLEKSKIRFEINPGAAEQQQVRLSSKLLSLAQIVRP